MKRDLAIITTRDDIVELLDTAADGCVEVGPTDASAIYTDADGTEYLVTVTWWAP